MFFYILVFQGGMLSLCFKFLPSMSSQIQVSSISTFQQISYIPGPSLRDKLYAKRRGFEVHHSTYYSRCLPFLKSHCALLLRCGTNKCSLYIPCNDIRGINKCSILTVVSAASSKYSNFFNLNDKPSYFNLNIQNPVCTGSFILVKPQMIFGTE